MPVSGSMSTASWEKRPISRIGALERSFWGFLGSTSKGLYAGTNYQEPLERFEAYANRLAGGGYSPEEFGRLVLRAFEAKRPRTR
jgi:hypothetical protein